jgi:hypothetical protein
MTLDEILGIMGLIVGSGGLGALALSRAQARKADAETHILTQSEEWKRLTAVVDALQEENARLCKRLETLERSNIEQAGELSDLRIGVVILISQLRESGIEPRWTPAPTRGDSTS